MTHAIIGSRMVCQAPADSLCRAQWDCDCEYLSALDQSPVNGLWHHVDYYDDEGLDVEHWQSGTYPEGKCHWTQWVNAFSGLWDGWAEQDDLWALRSIDDFSFPDGAVRIWWEEEDYVWEYAEPRVIGRLIGLAAGVRMAERQGFDWDEVAS